MAKRSFADIAEAMIRDAHWNITQLQELAADADLTSAQRHTVRDVLHAEGLHLDMLERMVREWERIT